MKTNNNTPQLSPEAVEVILSLQHPNGTYRYYRDSLDGLSRYVLHQSEEIGMSDSEALHTLRVLSAVKADLTAIAGQAAIPEAQKTGAGTTYSHVADRIAATFDAFHDSGFSDTTLANTANGKDEKDCD